MKIAHHLATAGLLASLFGSTVAMQAQYGPPQGPPPGPGYGAQGGWDAPPGALNDAQRRGFRDGIEGARKDYENHRPPNVNNRDEYRHPDVPRGLRRDYRAGFQQGYNAGVRHMMNGRPGYR